MANPKYKTWNLIKLKEEEIIVKYRKHFADNYLSTFEDWCKFPCTTQDQVDTTYGQVVGLVEQTASHVIGKTDRTKWRIPLIHPLLPGIREACRQLRRACQLGAEGAVEAFEELRNLRNEAAALAKNSIDLNWSHFIERFDRMESTELMKVARSFKAARSQNRSTQLETSAEALDRYAEHYQRQFSPPEDARPIAREPTDPAPSDSFIFVTPNLVKNAVSGYPNGKTGGPSGLKMELFKPLSDMIATPLAFLFNTFIKVGLVPSNWCEANIVPVPKKANSNQIKDHRPISLTEVLRKIFERCLLPSLVRTIGHAHFAQGGFEAAKGTIDQVAALNETFIMKRQRLGRSPCVAFLDIKAAYDSTDRNVLSNRLLELGSPKYLTRIIMALFDNNKSRVLVGGQMSPYITHPAGLLQGSSLSPTLYNCYIGGIMERLMNATTGIHLHPFGMRMTQPLLAEIRNICKDYYG